jgi:hypothetical protein
VADGAGRVAVVGAVGTAARSTAQALVVTTANTLANIVNF